MEQSVDERLIGKLEELASRLEELNRRLFDPEVVKDRSKSVALGKEAGRLRRILQPYREFRKVSDHLAQAQALAQDHSQDRALRELAVEEADELQRSYDELLERLKDRLAAGDEAGVSSVILEIRAGTGGEEAALFARDIYTMYLRYAEKQGFTVDVIDQSGSDMGGLKEIVLNVKGEGVYWHLGFEGGGHRVQRVPETESQGRIHTSAVTVAVLPEPDEIDVKINWENDVDEFVSRAGGPGGQNVNKVSSAIRLVHKVTGITVSMRDDKSQHKNRAKARRIMTTRLYDYFQSQVDDQRAEKRRSMIGSGDRSQRIRTYNFPQNRCTDHRINLDLYCLDKIMQGDLGPVISALQTHDKEQRLKNL